MESKKIPSKVGQELKRLDSELPNGASAGKWFTTEELSGTSKKYKILRTYSFNRKRSNQIFPARYYKDCATQELAEEFARFLNTLSGHDVDAERAIETLLNKNSVIPKRVIEQFKSYRLGEIGNKNSAYKDSIRYLENALLGFFLNKSNKISDWDSPEYVSEWREWLIAHQAWNSTSTYRKIVNYSTCFSSLFMTTTAISTL